jgi:signal transduction histidine kinase
VLFSPKFDWPRYVACARALLAAVALGVTWLYPQPQWGAPYYLFLWAFLAYAAALVFSSRWRSGPRGLAALFVDTVYFLLFASNCPEPMLWPASILFLYLLIEALALFGPVEVAVIAVATGVFCSVVPSGPLHLLDRTVVVAGVLACACAVIRRRLAGQIRDLEQNLREAREAAEKAKELERQRIASDFHDGPLQSFISLQMRLEILRKVMDRDYDAGMQDLQQLQGLAQAQVRDLRVFLYSMRPVDLDGSSLVAAARRAAESFQKESGIPVTFMGAATPVGLPQEMNAEVLQMVREALHNVQKHAGATRVAVALEKTDRGLEISVDDNGRGFSFAGAYTLEELELLRLGPASLKRRARTLNAEMLLESRPGRGAGLKFRIPLP